MEDGGIADSHITASSEHADFFAAIFGRLNFQDNGGGWAAGRVNDQQWLQVDLNSQDISVIRMATQGRASQDHYSCVKSYKLQYSNVKNDFHYYRAQGETTDKVKYTQNTKVLVTCSNSRF